MTGHWFARACLLVGALSLGATSVARADFNTVDIYGGNGSVCGGSNFATCASVSISWTGNVATVTVTNYGGNNEIFRAIGITNLPTGATATGVVVSTNDATSSWTLTTNSSLNGDPIEQQVVAFDRNGNVQNGLNVGKTITFTFTFSDLPAGSTSDYGVAIHAQSGPAPCGSTKIAFDGSGTVLNPSPTGSSTGCYTVPEPATMSLITTGLLGLGGMGFLRRRKKV